MALAKDTDMIQALAAQRANQSSASPIGEDGLFASELFRVVAVLRATDCLVKIDRDG